MDGKRRFTGKQITVMVVAVSIAVVAAPVGVLASTGQLTNITDPVTSSHKARVNGAGGLTTTAVDPVTKSQARVYSGRLSVGDSSGPLTVDGTVGARPAVPAHPVAAQVYNPTQVTPMKIFGPFSAKQKLAITSFTLTNTGNDPIQYGELEAFATDSNCDYSGPHSYPGDYVATASLAGHASVPMTYPSPMVLPTGNPGSTWCLFAVGNWAGGADVSLYFNVVGFVS